MTAKELIRQLEKVSPTLEVKFASYSINGAPTEVKGVQVILKTESITNNPIDMKGDYLLLY